MSFANRAPVIRYFQGEKKEGSKMHCDSAAGTPGTATTTTSVNDSDKSLMLNTKKDISKLPLAYLFSYSGNS